MFSVLDQRRSLAPLPSHDGPQMNVSLLTHFQRDLPVRGFSIKYVVEGTEHYRVEGRPVPVRAGEFLLVNRHHATSVRVEDAVPVKGICIELTAPLVDEVASALLAPEALEGAGAGLLSGPAFPEGRHRATDTHTGRALAALAQRVMPELYAGHRFDGTFYRGLAECVVADQTELARKLRAVPALRAATRVETFRRVQRAKEFIRASFRQAIDVRDMARVACMAEHHFHRAFKAVEGVPPHRYLVYVRMEAAIALLRSDLSVTETAFRCGFPDIHAFSRAFKRHFGVAPSAHPRQP